MEAKTRITFGIGVGERGDGTPIDHGTRQERLAKTIEYVTGAYGGCFVRAGIGGWVDDDGNAIHEPGIEVCVVADDHDLRDLLADAEYLRGLWEQTAIIVMTEPVASTMIR